MEDLSRAASVWIAARSPPLLAAEQARLAVLQDAVRLSEWDIAWLTRRLDLMEARAAAPPLDPGPRPPVPDSQPPARFLDSA